MLRPEAKAIVTHYRALTKGQDPSPIADGLLVLSLQQQLTKALDERDENRRWLRVGLCPKCKAPGLPCTTCEIESQED